MTSFDEVPENSGEKKDASVSDVFKEDMFTQIIILAFLDPLPDLELGGIVARKDKEFSKTKSRTALLSFGLPALSDLC
jgi:hypothetical protein